MKRDGRKHRGKKACRWMEALDRRVLLSATIYVDANSPDLGPGQTGTSWALAYTDLQQALASAVAGDEIRVADGTYRPTTGVDRNATFQLKSGVSVLGGYAGVGSADPDARDANGYRSFLSGDIGAAG